RVLPFAFVLPLAVGVVVIGDHEGGRVAARAAEVAGALRGQQGGPDVLADQQVAFVVRTGAGRLDGVAVAAQVDAVRVGAADGGADEVGVALAQADRPAVVVLPAAGPDRVRNLRRQPRRQSHAATSPEGRLLVIATEVPPAGNGARLKSVHAASVGAG